MSDKTLFNQDLTLNSLTINNSTDSNSVGYVANETVIKSNGITLGGSISVPDNGNITFNSNSGAPVAISNSSGSLSIPFIVSNYINFFNTAGSSSITNDGTSLQITSFDNLTLSSENLAIFTNGNITQNNPNAIITTSNLVVQASAVYPKPSESYIGFIDLYEPAIVNNVDFAGAVYNATIFTYTFPSTGIWQLYYNFNGYGALNVENVQTNFSIPSSSPNVGGTTNGIDFCTIASSGSNGNSGGAMFIVNALNQTINLKLASYQQVTGSNQQLLFETLDFGFSATRIA